MSVFDLNTVRSRNVCVTYVEAEDMLTLVSRPSSSKFALKTFHLLYMWFHTVFARESISAHMLSQFRLSVRLSVTRVIHAKTVEVRIMQFFTIQ